MVIWPGILSNHITPIPTFDDVASLFHFIAALLLTLVAGCSRRFFAGFIIYQLVTTSLKTLLLAGHTLADWRWDFFGDIEEYAAGAGLIYLAGLNDRIPARGVLGRLCSWRGIAAMFAALMTVWAVLFVMALSGG